MILETLCNFWNYVTVKILSLAYVRVCMRLILLIHCVQKKTPTHIYFHISKSGV